MKFKDSEGFSWVPRFDVTIAREIRTACEIDLLTLVGCGQAFERIETDRDLLARCLFMACRQQATDAGIDEAEFGRRLAGEVFNEAQTALRGSVTAFLAPPKYHLSSPDARPPSMGGQAELQGQVSSGMFSTIKGEQSGRLSG